MVNAIASMLARAGIGQFHLLTTRGRRTGRPHIVPVVLVEQDGRSWLRPAEAGPVLKRYVGIASRTRAYFQASMYSLVDDFVAEADRHPCSSSLRSARPSRNDVRGR